MAGTKLNSRQALADLEEALVLAGPAGTRNWPEYRRILTAMTNVLDLVEYADPFVVEPPPAP